MMRTKYRKTENMLAAACLWMAWIAVVVPVSAWAVEPDASSEKVELAAPDSPAASADTAKEAPPEKEKLKPPVSAAEIARAIRDLDSDQFSEREAAVTELLAYGKPAIASLSRAAVKGSAEVSWRAIYILKEMALRLDFEELEAAELALQELTASENDIARQRAGKVMGTLEQQRSVRATEAVTKLGGKLLVEGYLKVDGDWKGGDAGLGYIARMKNMERISFEASSGVSLAAVAKLRTQLPDVAIHRFGKAFLGVGGDFDLNGMIVTSVVPESGAAKAGIEPNDIIILIDGKKVGNFDALVKVISEKNAGDEITLKYYRHVSGDIVNAKTKLTSRPGSLD